MAKKQEIGLTEKQLKIAKKDFSAKQRSQINEERQIISKKRKGLNKKQLAILAKQQLPLSNKASKNVLHDKEGNTIIETNAKPNIYTQMRIDIEFTKQKGKRFKKIRVIGKSRYHLKYDQKRMFKEAFFQAFAQCTFSPDKWVLFGIYHRIKTF